ncbi:helix-turn-helix domain-containing protein [Mesorhizobium sp. CGMCC 1.15528]|uniref:Helix-turn-helix domain-containing protein n=1 Tax=Mesorhizobium zhangyense TaxID=1776730 RepID=A0A7C9RC64_9HYPH|nr:helix-turn-helix domain-containing protein [Mesorhizobium zhangyense]NGN44997.1 helix-turn-helix domain-containing protein [Mesorhizobium zhangyense]
MDDHEEFRLLCSAIYGYGAQSKVAREFGWTFRSVHRWYHGKTSVPKEVLDALRRKTEISSPTSGATCKDAIALLFTRLVIRAMRAGWQENEIRTAIIELASDGAAFDI